MATHNVEEEARGWVCSVQGEEAESGRLPEGVVLLELH